MTPNVRRAVSDFPRRLLEARKQRGLTQQAVADHIGVHVSQERRYEAGESQPTLEVASRLPAILGVTLDWLVFGDDGPDLDTEVRRALDDLQRLEPDQRATALAVIEALRHQHDTGRRRSPRKRS